MRLIAVALILAACSAPAMTQPSPTPAVTSPIAAAPAAATATPPGPSPVPPGTAGSTAVLAVPSCTAPARPTTAQTEGPFFKAGSPERASLVTAGISGTKIQLVGFVLTRSCAPVDRAKVDIWQADANGSYDNTGYTLRGHVLTDARGKFQIETIVPARYPGRTPHIHVKVIPPGGPELTTQLYMPNDPANASDGIFRPELTMQIIPSPHTGLFTFILDKP